MSRRGGSGGVGLGGGGTKPGGYKDTGGPKHIRQPGKPKRPVVRDPFSGRGGNGTGGAPLAKPVKSQHNSARPGKPHSQKPTTAKPHHNGGNNSGGGNKGGKKGGGKNSSSYDYLAPLSPAALRKQAQLTISAAYKPDFSELNSDQQRATAIYNKQQQDNQFYQNWLNTKLSGLQAEAGTQASQLAQQLTAAREMTQQAFANQAGNLTDAANARQGNVSDNSQSTAFGQDLTNNQNLATESMGVGQQANLGGIQAGTQLVAANNANTLGAVAAGAQKENANFQQQLADLATQRSKLRLSKAADIQKEIARLQGIEIQKAQNEQQTELAARKLFGDEKQNAIQNALDKARIKAEVRGQNISAQEARDRIKEQQWEAQLRAKTSLTEEQMRTKLGLTEAQMRQAYENKSLRERVQHDMAQNKIDKARVALEQWRAHHPSSTNHNPGGSQLTANEQNEMFSKINQTRGIINGLFSANNSPGRDTAVYQALANGTPIQIGVKHLTNGKTEPDMKTFGPIDPAILNAAFDLSSTRSGLTPHDIQKLRQIGLRNIRSRYHKLA